PGFVPGNDTTVGTAQVTKYDCNEIGIKAGLAAPGLLVLTDCYAPDWKVYVDGRRAELLPAYHTFRAVALAAGEHEVTFRYESKYYQLGSYVSLLALVFLVGTLGFAAVRGKRKA
ncbi:YfhO family protein, partial [candidate division WOR-3 bacterium]|nr:YfhO family protein [candidate division WOR-3 bacterium]